MAILKVANIHLDVTGTTVIRANGGNTMTVSTAGSEVARIDQNGNLGIGTSNPGYKLDVAGQANISTGMIVAGLNVVPYIQNVGSSLNVSIGAAFTQANGAQSNAGAAFGVANLAYANANSAFIKIYAQSTPLNTNVYVVGTNTSPNGSLSILGTGSVSVSASGVFGNNTIYINGDTSVGGGANAYAQTVGAAANGWANTVFGYSNTYAQSVGAASNGWANTVATYSNTNIYVDSVNAVRYILFSEQTSGTLTKANVNTANFVVNPNSGNVSIGRNDTPTYKLDVAGSINAASVLVNGVAISTGGLSSFTANVGNSSANAFNVTHSLNKTFVMPAVREWSTGYFVYPDIKYTSANTIQLEFVVAPSTNQYTLMVVG
jgi:hypothetical protein